MIQKDCQTRALIVDMCNDQLVMLGCVLEPFASGFLVGNMVHRNQLSPNRQSQAPFSPRYSSVWIIERNVGAYSLSTPPSMLILSKRIRNAPISHIQPTYNLSKLFTHSRTKHSYPRASRGLVFPDHLAANFIPFRAHALIQTFLKFKPLLVKPITGFPPKC